LLSLLLLPFLSTDDQHVAFYSEVDVGFRNAGQIGGNAQFFFALMNVELRRCDSAAALVIFHGMEVVEQPVHLSMKGHEGIATPSHRPAAERNEESRSHWSLLAGMS
jgi:hypothetical protein